MKKKYIFNIIALLLAAGIYSCTTGKKTTVPPAVKIANKVYDSTAKAYAKVIVQQPLEDSVMADSMKVPAYWVGTTNFGMRRPNMVIIHHTAQDSCGQTLYTFTLQRTQVSAHYVICKDGAMHHMLNDYLRAWHAGNSKWGNNTDINSCSIGIELDNNGRDTFSYAQINTLMGLLSQLKKAYNIPTANFLGHADIAPTRKVDPSIHFPWKQLADSGYGHWYGDTTQLKLPPDFNTIIALRIIGYDVTDPNAALLAFRRHFLINENKGELSLPEKKVLYSLMKKFL